jgi:hypothetical protein
LCVVSPDPGSISVREVLNDEIVQQCLATVAVSSDIDTAGIIYCDGNADCAKAGTSASTKIARTTSLLVILWLLLRG